MHCRLSPQREWPSSAAQAQSPAGGCRGHRPTDERGATTKVVMDWRGWHDGYDDPASSLSRRLVVVQTRLAEVVARGDVRSVLSLCAGDGRDIIPVLAARSPRVS